MNRIMCTLESADLSLSHIFLSLQSLPPLSRSFSKTQKFSHSFTKQAIPLPPDRSLSNLGLAHLRMREENMRRKLSVGDRFPFCPQSG